MRKRNDKQATTSNNIIGWVVVAGFVVAVGLLVSWVLSSDNDNTNSGGEDTSPPTAQLEDDTNTDQPVTDDEAVEPEPPAAPTRDAVGAEAAAVAAMYDLVDDERLSIEEHDELLRWWATPDAEAQLLEEKRSARDAGEERSAAATGPLRTDSAVLATKVVDVDDEQARVDVWMVQALSMPGFAPPQAVWTTTELQLLWIDNRWQVNSLQANTGPIPGTPSWAEPEVEANEFQAALEGFMPWHGRVPSNRAEQVD